ncbi:glycosyltransferase WbuB [Rhizobium leguminosarum]|uniref:glycosyltransferase family 4 protein n=1 Tax=Rhizobium leguminosarum TaxID=384 RepID=UPI0010313DA9|nr:glycosyltransferase family 4 protein [Rhizobium leguminosarum]TBG24184.1 glycosyltransferase WbuB [Rhizobium leguminosarum]TBG40705.1 glycosyltransferase WbuB [Rhizobium leguminosarum]
MRLLLWSQYFWPENFPINEIASELVRAGVSVTVLTGKPNYPDGRFFQGYKGIGILHEHFMGASVVRIPILPRGGGSAARLALNYISFVLSGYLCAPIALRRHQFDAIFVYAPSPLIQALPALFLSFLKRAPMTLWVQDLWPDALKATGHVKSPCLLRLVEAAVRYIYRQTDLILIQSEAFRAPVERLANHPDKIRYFPNLAKVTTSNGLFSTTASRLASTIKESFSVVFAGNVGRAQSVETIVEAAYYLRDARNIKIFVVGSGSRLEWLKAEKERLALKNIVLAGRFPASDMPPILDAASALLVTLGDDPTVSLTVPSKIQGFLARGRPIIACLNGEGARIIKEAEAGLVCPSGNSVELAQAILNLAGMSDEEREQFGINAKCYFMDRFELTRRIRELIDHLAQMKRTDNK